MPYTINSSDRESFQSCRRAWDLGSGLRQNYEPVAATQAFDFDQAMHYALAVYYFPAMWDWNRSIVRPLALQGFVRSMREQREDYAARHEFTPEQDEEWNGYLELGKSMLEDYFEWASAVDDFDTMRVETDMAVNIPDPWSPGNEMVTPAGEPIRFGARIELLVVDQEDQFWLVDHRLAGRDWADTEQLLLDEELVAQCWACELHYLKVAIAGTVYNELSAHTLLRPSGEAQGTWANGHGGSVDSEPARAPRDPQRWSELTPPSQQRGGSTNGEGGEQGRLVYQEGNEFFRRTWIRRGRTELDNAGRHMALLARDMTDPELLVYPSPSQQHCPRCNYRELCIGMNEGSDVDGIVRASYRKRPAGEYRRARIGGGIGTWCTEP